MTLTLTQGHKYVSNLTQNAYLYCNTNISDTIEATAFKLGSMTLTLIQGHSGSAEEKNAVLNYLNN